MEGEQNKSRSIPTEQLSEAAERDILDAIEHVLQPLGIQTASVHRERAFVEIIASNRSAFVVFTWDPRDRYMYWIGPLVDQRIPALELWYDPNRSPNRYELGWFAALRAGLLPVRERAEVHNQRNSARSGARAIALLTAKELCGDWSDRSVLDRMILENYRVNVEPYE